MQSFTQPEFAGSERFLVQRRLGEGGFGVVYQALDRKQNTVVALKTLRQFDAAALARFKQEFRALTDVSHPNLVSLYELVAEGDSWFFTMELVEGSNLLQYVSKQAPLPTSDWPLDPSTSKTVDTLLRTKALDPIPDPISDLEEEAAQMVSPGVRVSTAPRNAGLDADRLRDAFAQLAEGVCILHEAGMLHRDLKPSNVLVTREGRVVLLDFGLVSHLAPEDATQSIQVAGTPHYMSPEQTAGLAITEASDWYSVGIMLYEALTGCRPFTGSILEILSKKQTAEPPSPEQVAPGLPKDLSDLCRSLLQVDPKARPSGREVHRLLAKGLTGALRVSQPAATPVSQAVTLIGRERHTQALREALQTAKGGKSVAVFVYGESGMGKTTLVRSFLKDLRQRERDLVLLAGRCYEQESVPYKALDSLIDNLSGYLKRLAPAESARLMPRDVLALARLFPVLKEVEAVAGGRQRVTEIPDVQELRRRAFSALRELLARIADQSLLVLFIDDLQWGDVDSGLLLRELLRPPDAPTMMLLICFRSEDADTSPLLKMLLPSRGAALPADDVRELEVGELTLEEARALAVAQLSGRELASKAGAEELATESGGNPFFLNELVRYSVEGGETQPGESTLDKVIQNRVARLPEEARRLLEVVAVAGRPVKTRVAGEAAGFDGEEHPVIGALRAGRLVRTRGMWEENEIETYHDRIRKAVTDHLPAETRKSLHQRLAAAWERSGQADPETLCSHFQGAGDLASASKYALQAAERASKALAFDRAAEHYRLALELRLLGKAEERAVRTRLGEALANAGRGATAAEAYLVAAEGAGRGEGLELRRRAAEQFLISGHIDEGLTALRGVLRMMEMKLARTPQRALLLLLARRAQLRLRGLRFRERPASELTSDELIRIDTGWSVAIGLGVVDIIRGAHFQSRHLLEALRAGEPYRIARAVAIEVGFSSVRGGHSRARTEKLLRMMQTLAERVNQPHALGLAALEGATAANLAGHFAGAREMAERAESILREHCTGVAWELDTAQLFWLHSLLWLGEWKEIFRRLPVLLQDAEQRGDLYIATYMRTRIAHLLHLSADQPDRAREELHRGIAAWSVQGFHLQHYWAWLAEGEIDLYAGRPADAWKRLADRWPEFTRSLLPRTQAIHIESLFLRARVALALAGQRSPASKGRAEARNFLQHAERDARSIEREKMQWSDPLAQLVRAGISALRGDAPEAARLAASAEAGFEAGRMTQFAAAARWRHGELLPDNEGHPLIEAADAWMSGQGVKNSARMIAMLTGGRMENPTR